MSSVATAAGNIAADKWLVPRAEGKWSPAEVIEHLILTYDTFLGELAGGPGMKIRTKWWQRALWRFTYLPRLLAGAPFPKGVPAPREVRPAVTRSQSDAIAALRERAARLDAAVAAALGSGRKVTHAYLGRLSLTDGVLFSARHLQHHQKQLE